MIGFTPLFALNKMLFLDSLGGIYLTIIGITVVFIALLILVIFLYTSGSFFKAAKPSQKQPEKPKAAAPVKPAPKAVPAAKPAPAAAEDDSEVIAVIMAAISAMSAADGKQYRIKSVRPVTRGGSGRSAWAQAGIADLTRPF